MASSRRFWTFSVKSSPSPYKIETIKLNIVCNEWLALDSLHGVWCDQWEFEISFEISPFQPAVGIICIQWNSFIPTLYISVYSRTPLFQHSEMRTSLYTVEPLYSNPLKWGHLCIQWNSSIPTLWNEDISVYSGTPLFQPPEMRTPLYTVEPLYSNTLKWGHLCIQWNPSIPTPWNEDTSVYSRTPLFQHSEMRTPLYTVELLYSNTLKWGHLCIQWNSSIPTSWNEDTSVYSGTPLFQLPEMRTCTSVYSGTPLFKQPFEIRIPLYKEYGHLDRSQIANIPLKWRHPDIWIWERLVPLKYMNAQLQTGNLKNSFQYSIVEYSILYSGKFPRGNIFVVFNIKFIHGKKSQLGAVSIKP